MGRLYFVEGLRWVMFWFDSRLCLTQSLEQVRQDIFLDAAMLRHGVVRGARSGGARRALSLREHKARDAGSHIDLQEIDSLIYRAEQSILWVPPGGRGVFGGQVIGQALHSATRTVEGAIGPHGVRTMAPHSLHGYFLQAGDPTHPITYRVRRTSDRRSYVSRSVDAVQRGEIIFKMQASFARAGETGLEHYAPMPDVPPPDELPSVRELLEDVLPRLPDAAAAHLRKLLTVPIEMKFVGDYLSPLDPNPPKLPARQQIWIRAYEPIREASGSTRARPRTSPTTTCSRARCGRTASRSRARSSASSCRSTTACGSTRRSAATSGCSTTWTAPRSAPAAG